MAYIQIDSDNLKYNINQLKSKKELFAVIKDNAYGHGITLIADLLKQNGVHRFCVRDNTEANNISSFAKEILVFFPDYEVENVSQVSYTISDINQLKSCKHKYIHLKFDTGMHRNAISLNDIDEALKLAFSKYEVRGVFSHFCCSDEFGCDTFIQLDRFKHLRNKIINFCKANGFDIPKFHMPNSDAIFRLKDFDMFDYIRPGIALYGGIDNTKPVMSLWGEKIKSFKLYKNQGVGYNKKYIMPEDSIVTLIDLGYSDGILYFDKELTLKNTKAIGKISMDSMMVLGEFEKVCIFDNIREFVKNYPYTITYDILTKLNPSIKRICK